MKTTTLTKPKIPIMVDALNRLIGKENVLYTLEDRLCYAYDGSKQKHIPDVVLRPRSTQHASNILQYANEQEIPVYPRGAGSGLTGGSVPAQGGIVMDFTHMNRILEPMPSRDWQNTVLYRAD